MVQGGTAFLRMCIYVCVRVCVRTHVVEHKIRVSSASAPNDIHVTHTQTQLYSLFASHDVGWFSVVAGNAATNDYFHNRVMCRILLLDLIV